MLQRDELWTRAEFYLDVSENGASFSRENEGSSTESVPENSLGGIFPGK
jgi:hypothetical protein